jgi:hypothetical protein
MIQIIAPVARFALVLLFFLPMLSCTTPNLNTMNNPSNKQFPVLKGEALSGRTVVFPQETHGRTALYIIAVKQEGQKQVDAWLKPWLKHFEGEKAVTVYEIPMISTGWRIIKPIIDSGMRSGTPEGLHDNVVTFFGDRKPYMEQLGIRQDERAYVYLVDSIGEIRWQKFGMPTQADLDTLYKEAKQVAGITQPVAH